MSGFKIKVWKLPHPDGRVARAATIEHGPRKENPNCDGCQAPCCKGFAAVLNTSEFLFRKYKFVLRAAPEYIAKQVPAGVRGHLMITVPEVNGICYYLDPETNRCHAWPDIPVGCLSYDCRDDDRPEVAGYVKRRKLEGTWREE